MCVQVWYVQIEIEKNKYVWWINNVNSVVCSTFIVKCSWDGLLGEKKTVPVSGRSGAQSSGAYHAVSRTTFINKKKSIYSK